MNICIIAGLIYDYTSGYPYLVSYLCKSAHERKKGKEWSREDILAGVKEILTKRNTLFDDMIKHLNEYTELNQMLQNILFKGQAYTYNAYSQPISIGEMFGFIVNNNGTVAIANRIFETGLYDYFLSEMMISQNKTIISNQDKSQFIKNGLLDMQIYEKQKGTEVEASTSVTATKGEKTMISICTAVYIIIVIVAFVLIITRHVAVGVILAIAGIILVTACLLLVLLNPQHKQERKENLEVYKK